MRQWAGSVGFGFLGILVGAIGPATDWPLWAWIVVGGGLLAAAVLTSPPLRRHRPDYAAIARDADALKEKILRFLADRKRDEPPQPRPFRANSEAEFETLSRAFSTALDAYNRAIKDHQSETIFRFQRDYLAEAHRLYLAGIDARIVDRLGSHLVEMDRELASHLGSAAATIELFVSSDIAIESVAKLMGYLAARAQTPPSSGR